MMLIMNFTMIAILWFGAHGIDRGLSNIGDMMAFMQYGMLILFSFHYGINNVCHDSQGPGFGGPDQRGAGDYSGNHRSGATRLILIRKNGAMWSSGM